jgi:hypothetical protein
MGHYKYRPLSDLLRDVHARYRRPLCIAETGAEGSARAAWLYYVAREVIAAKLTNVDVQGICLYPVTDYPGWEDGRLCETGLLTQADESGRRHFYQPLVDELISSAALLRATTRSGALIGSIIDPVS